jgi:MAC/Perforin domain
MTKRIDITFDSNGEGKLKCYDFGEFRCLGNPDLEYPKDLTIVDPDTHTSHRRAIQDITDADLKTLIPTPGQSRFATLVVIRSREELLSKLNAEADVSYSGLFSASAQAKYLREMKMNKYSTLVLANANIENSSQVISCNPKLTPEAEEALKNRGWKEFIATYGTTYLSTVKTGGRFYGMILIESTTAEEQEKIAVAVSASGWGAKVNGKLEKELQEVTENHKTTVTILQSAGGKDPLEVSPEEMIEQWKTFPELVEKNPVPILGTFEEYKDTILLPQGIGGTDEQKLHQAKVLKELGKKYLEYSDIRENLDFVRTHMTDFE